jgi:ABC-type amino acid transport substrate-binding protein
MTSALLMPAALQAQTPETLVCGVAQGFPPYQFQTSDGIPLGIDVEVARLVFSRLGVPYRIDQANWDDLYLALIHQTGRVRVLAGAEVNEERKKYLAFSHPYYARSTGIFVLSKSPFNSLADLQEKKITGDRASFIESYVRKGNIRLVTTPTKEESFQLLAKGKVDAVIAPIEVGRWIAKRSGLTVRILPERDKGFPVAFAVSKTDKALAAKISTVVDELIQTGKIREIMKKYQ